MDSLATRGRLKETRKNSFATDRASAFSQLKHGVSRCVASTVFGRAANGNLAAKCLISEGMMRNSLRFAREALQLDDDVPPRDRWDRLCSPAVAQCDLAGYAAAVYDRSVDGAAWSTDNTER